MTRSPRPGMTRKPTRRASSSRAAPTRLRLWLSICWQRLRSTPSRRSCRSAWRARAAVPDQLGIEARPRDLVIFGMHLAEVEVDEAVVHRRHERIRAKDRRAGNIVVAARRVDDDHVGMRNELVDRSGEGLFGLLFEHW